MNFKNKRGIVVDICIAVCVIVGIVIMFELGIVGIILGVIILLVTIRIASTQSWREYRQKHEKIAEIKSNALHTSRDGCRASFAESVDKESRENKLQDQEISDDINVSHIQHYDHNHLNALGYKDQVSVQRKTREAQSNVQYQHRPW